MPIPDEENFDPDLPEFAIPEVGSTAADDSVEIPVPSEIATRLNLLGKLIIPRAPR